MRAKAPLADQGEQSRASPASTRLRGSELSYFDNPSVKNQRFLPAPFTQGSWGAPAPVHCRCFSKEAENCTTFSTGTRFVKDKFPLFPLMRGFLCIAQSDFILFVDYSLFHTTNGDVLRHRKKKRWAASVSDYRCCPLKLCFYPLSDTIS